MRKLLLILAMAVAVVASAADAPTAVRVQPTSGDAVTFLFETSPELQMHAKRFTVTSTAHPAGVTFEFDAVESIDFVATSSVENTEMPGIIMTMDNGTLNFSNVPENSPVSVNKEMANVVLSIDGRREVNTSASDTFSLSLNDMAQGIYIVRVAGFVTKVSF